MQRVGDLAGWLMVAVVGTAVVACVIWIVRSVLRDMKERGSPKWARVLWFPISLIPPAPMWGLVFLMWDQRRYPPGPDGGSGWMGATRRWGLRLRGWGSHETPGGDRRRQLSLLIAAVLVIAVLLVRTT
jgi:hypothetical protein